MYRGSCRYLTIPRLGAACRKPGPGERTSFHRNSVGPAPSGRANGMSQASRSFLDFSERLWVFSSLIDFSRHFCHFLAFWDIPAIFWLSHTLLPFPGFLGHPCHFLTFPDISVISWLSGTFLPFSGFLGHLCHFLAFWDIS
ncbi:hypothetical protein Taro_018648, partial [Colocasia esculenta]|nr:hypothetical protein [Colocasia esculenta]